MPGEGSDDFHAALERAMFDAFSAGWTCGIHQRDYETPREAFEEWRNDDPGWGILVEEVRRRQRPEPEKICDTELLRHRGELSTRTVRALARYHIVTWADLVQAWESGRIQNGEIRNIGNVALRDIAAMMDPRGIVRKHSN